jgi:transcriptional regulator with XRE-family HTH domain
MGPKYLMDLPGMRLRAYLETFRHACKLHGLSKLAKVACLSSRHISRILKGQVVPSFEIILKLHQGVKCLQEEADDEGVLIT